MPDTLTESLDSSLDQLRRSFAAVDALIGNIRLEQWSEPTPCDEWDVRRVVEHLVAMNRVFAAMLAGEAPPARRDSPAVEELASEFRQSAASLVQAFERPGVLGRSFAGPLGSATGQERLMIRLYDLLAHGWDIACGTGQEVRLPDDASEAALQFAREQVTDDARPGRFKSAQAVADKAPAIERLIAFLGRRLN